MKTNLILIHRNPDGDCVGSGFALKKMLENNGQKAWVVCADEVPERLQFLSYGQESLFCENMPEGFEEATVISCDVASVQQLGALAERFPHIDIVIDHHHQRDLTGEKTLVSEVSATGEILTNFYQYYCNKQGIAPDMEVCNRLYAAISSDTGCFRYSNATAKTHNLAGWLLDCGVDGAKVNHALLESTTYETLKAQARGIENMQTCFDGKVAVIPFSYFDKQELGVKDEHLDNLVNTARCLSGVSVGISVRQPNEEGVFRVSTRSNEEYDVSALCAKFGGGGHIKAAGCTIEADSMDEAITMLLSQIDTTKL